MTLFCPLALFLLLMGHRWFVAHTVSDKVNCRQTECLFGHCCLFLTSEKKHHRRCCLLLSSDTLYSQCTLMPCGDCPAVQKGCLIILYSDYSIAVVYWRYLALVRHSCTFLAIIPFTLAGKSHQIIKETWCGWQKAPAPCRLLPYLYATPILLFNLLDFKVTKIATCRTAACVSLWKKSP